MDPDKNTVEIETYRMTETVFDVINVVKEYTTNQNNQFKVNPDYKNVNMFMGIITGKIPPSTIEK